MTRTIIIGDIHGMKVELVSLFKQVGVTKDDQVVLCGDLIDKGPDSPGVVSHLREMREQGYDITLVKGNHEEKHERFRTAYAKAGDKVKMKGFDELKSFTEALSPEDVVFLETAVIYHWIPGHNALVIHAGIMPTMESLPTLDEYAAMSKGDRSKFDRVLRVRHVTGETQAKVTVEFDGLGFDPGFEHGKGLTPQDVERFLEAMSIVMVRKQVRPEGSFISLGQEGPNDPFWAETYDGRFGWVYFGHSPFVGEEPTQFPHATGLDTGCVFGGSLTAVILEEGHERKFVSVKASGKFSSTFDEE